MQFIKNSDVVLRTIHGSTFLIDISDNYSGDKCSLYEINETGRFLWNNLEHSRTVDDLVKALQDAVIDEVPYGVMFNDVLEYINDLKDKGFVLEMVVNG